MQNACISFGYIVVYIASCKHVAFVYLHVSWVLKWNSFWANIFFFVFSGPPVHFDDIGRFIYISDKRKLQVNIEHFFFSSVRVNSAGSTVFFSCT